MSWKNTIFATLFGAVLVFSLLGMRAGAQTNAPAAAPALADKDQILAHLNAVIKWYKNLGAKASPGQQPSDTIYANNAESLAGQVVRLAFESARAQASLESPNSGPDQNTQEDSANPSAQKYAQYEAQVSQRIADDQAQIDALKGKPVKGGRAASQAQEQSLQGKLALDKATLDAVEQMKKFVENGNSGGTSLERSINDLANSVPELFALTPTTATTNTANANAKVTAAAVETPKTQPTAQTGLIGQLMVLYGEMESIRGIEARLSEADGIEKIATQLRGPLRTQLSATLQEGKSLANQTGVPKKQYDALTQKFKQLSAAMLPLSEEVVVLQQSRSNLTQWRKSHTDESRNTLISILSRVFFILAAIGIILGLSEVWRRLTFRYAHDPRRRRQFLVLRRFVMGFFISLIVILGFASEFSSLATFAGFVTAGIAVGLQTVLLSVAAYFFVVGRYGIRVGDRISVAGVTGDVIDVGLVRFYLMEYAGTGVDMYPTGRIVVFANSVLFQATTPLFKQFPGTRYTWHEAVLPLAPGADYSTVKTEFDAAVEPIYKEYSLDTKWRSGSYDDQMEISMIPPTPEQRLQFSDSGPELVARYPVDLSRAAEIDQRITTALMQAFRSNEKLAASLAGSPKIRAAVKV